MNEAPSSLERINHTLSDAAQGTLSGPEQLIEAFYPELRRLAATKMRHEVPDHTLQPTALVNELYLELLRSQALRPVKPQDSQQKSAFFALAGQVMRWLLIRHTRRLSWHAEMSELPVSLADPTPGFRRLAELDSVLSELAAVDPQLRSVVELRVFEGLSIEECGVRLGCSVSTVTRNWRYAKLWLRGRMAPENDVRAAT